MIWRCPSIWSGPITAEFVLPERYSRLHAALAGHYRLQRELGRGGMATVFLAQDLKHDRPVALKLLRPELAATVGPARFTREIQLAARLQHPRILTVHDSGEAGGQLWFTMPFVDGESLRDRLKRERQLPVLDAVRIAREAALGLEYAHQHGVIHRDIKPENLLLTTDGSTLVADFGIARLLDGGNSNLTDTGLVMGTPAYMSPEQATGARDVDARSDVYALGCVLYEMLAGEPPFRGPTAQALMTRAMTESPRPIHAIRDGIPEALDAVVARAMARLPAERFPSMASFAKALSPRVSGSAWTTVRPVNIRPSRLWPSLRRSKVTMVLLAGMLLGGGLLAWRHARGAVSAGESSKLLAVLPFENLGSPGDEYFADGVTDEVRGKLTSVAGLQVTARGSSIQYKRTTKSLQQIGQELGVQYLLTGTVRWERGAGGASRVHVSPELVQVSSGTSRWQAPFDAALTDVFQVQADIAGRVAQALDVALGDSARQRLAEQPTRSMAAYDAFLRGEAASQGISVLDPPSLRVAAGAYGQAVALDPGFVEAWARLSTVHSLLYATTPVPAEAEAARRAAERATTLAPDRSEGHRAWGMYYRSVPTDNPRALAEDSIAVVLAPGNAEVLSELASREYALGRWEASRVHLEQAARLDPRSILTARRVAFGLLYSRHYPEARAAHERALALAPANLVILLNRAMIELGSGDLAAARAVLHGALTAVDSISLVAFVASYQDLMWVLDDNQQAMLLRLGPEAFDHDRVTWGITLAQTYWLRGDRLRARVYADSARLAIEEQLRTAPNDPQPHAYLGLALAYLGRKDEAIREGQRSVALGPIARDAINGTYYQHQLARIYLLTGEPEKALDMLEPLLTVPYVLSPGWLRIDPNFDALRGNPRFERMMAGES